MTAGLSSIQSGSPSDDFLIQQIAGGQEGALIALYERYAPLVTGLGLQMLEDPQAVERGVFDVFANTWRYASRYDASRASVAAWLLSVAHHHFLHKLRQWPGFGASDEAGSDLIFAASQARRVQEATGKWGEEALGDLMLNFAYYRGASRQQLAQLSDLPVGEVARKVRQALDRMHAAHLGGEIGDTQPGSGGQEPAAATDADSSPLRDDLLGFALDQLGPQDQHRIQAQLDTDPALRAELHRDLGTLKQMVERQVMEAGQPSRPFSGQRLVEHLRHEEERRSLERQVIPPPQYSTVEHTYRAAPVPVPATAQPTPPVRGVPWVWPALLALGLAGALVFTLRPTGDVSSRYAKLPGSRVIPLEGRQGGGQVGQAVHMPDGRVYLTMSRALEPGRVYQVWRLLPGPTLRPIPRSLGIFESGIMTRAMPKNAVLIVTVEPPGGSEAPTTPPLFKQRL